MYASINTYCVNKRGCIKSPIKRGHIKLFDTASPLNIFHSLLIDASATDSKPKLNILITVADLSTGANRFVQFRNCASGSIFAGNKDRNTTRLYQFDFAIASTSLSCMYCVHAGAQES